VSTIAIDDDPRIIHEIRELYAYVRLLGQHIKLLHNRLEQMETRIAEVDASHKTSIHANASEITHLQERLRHQVELASSRSSLR
jgi:predicted RNase H-like nuclease (RuvC/YqgF family)